MKSQTIISLALTALILAACGAKAPVKVACIGDSITEGTCIDWQCDNSYPAQLDSLLGDGYSVMNFGRAATTMMKDGDFPYWSAKELRNALNYRADIAVIMHGTNDEKAFQWNPDKYAASYQAMIDTLLAVNPATRIILCLPIPVAEEKWDMTDSCIVHGVHPVVRDLAEKNGLELVDMYKVMDPHRDLYADGVHPTREGAGLMAAAVAKAITQQ